MDTQMITIKFVDGPPPDSFDDGSDFAQDLNNFANPGNLNSLYESSSTNWDDVTPMTGSHIPGVDTGARGGETTFMAGGGQTETIGSGMGSFGGDSTPYESMLRDSLLSQLPLDEPNDSRVCTAGSDGTNDVVGTTAETLAIGGDLLEGTGLAAGHIPAFDIGLGTSGASAGYINTLLAYGGKAPPWLSGPSFEFNIGTDSGTLRNASWVADLSKYAPWVEDAGHVVGITGLTVEGYDAITSGSSGKITHFGVDAGMMLTSTMIGGPIGFTLGAAWTVLDAAVQHDAYQGLHGWPAGFARYGDTVIRMRKADPGFMIDKW